MKILNKIISGVMVIAVVIAFMPFVTDNAYAASRYGTKEARITQNEKMYKKAAAMSSSTRAKYLIAFGYV